MCCPFCEHIRLDKPLNQRPDRKFHLHLNTERDTFICFRCNTTGRASRLLPNLDFFRMPSPESAKDLLNSILRVSDATLPQPEHIFDLNEISYPMIPTTRAWEYLTSYRKLSPEVVDYYGIRVGFRRLEGRVIVPNWNADGQCNYYSSRTYTAQTPKYMNPRENRSGTVFHIDRIQGDTVILCEGVFSAIAAGPTAVAILGKFISARQYHLIASKFKTVYIALDGDVPVATKIDIQIKFLALGISCGVINLPKDHDPDSVGSEEFSRLLSTSRVFHSHEVSPKFWATIASIDSTA